MDDFLTAQKKFTEIAQHTDVVVAPDQWNMAAGLADIATGLAKMAERQEGIEMLLSKLVKTPML